MHRRFRRSTITFSDRGFDTTSIHTRYASAIHTSIYNRHRVARRRKASGLGRD